jgi:hypothetical protein
MTFKDWLVSKKLDEQPTSSNEIIDLLKLADQKIDDCEKMSACGVSAQTYHENVYMAAIPSAKAILRVSGYRTSEETKGGQDILFQCLTFTVYPNPKDIIVFGVARKLRKQSAYDSVAEVEPDATDLFNKVKKLRVDVESWIRKNHPRLLKSQTTEAAAANESPSS